MSPVFRWLLAAALLPAAALAADPAPAPVADTALDTLAGRLQMPFAYALSSRDFATGTLSGHWSREEITLVPTAGVLAGREVVVHVHYISPDRLDAGFVQGAVRSEVEKAASEEQTSLVRQVPVAGFDFSLIERTRERDQETRRVTRLVGTINGAMLAIEVERPDDASLDAEMQARLPALVLDFPSLLRLRGHFERERDRILKDGAMQTPAGRVSPPRGVEPRLLSLGVSRDGEGKVVSASHIYGFYRLGFWSEQRLGLHVACDLRADDPEVRANALEPFTEDKTVTMLPGAVDESIGGHPAKLVTGRRVRDKPAYEADIRRWAAVTADEVFVAQVERVNGLGLAQEIEKTLKAMSFTCDPATGIGAVAAKPKQGVQG